MRALLVAAALATLLAAPVEAAPKMVCKDRADILDGLKRGYDESPRVIGLGNDGGVLELIVGPSGSWTLIISYPGKPTCVVGAGVAFEMLPLGDLM